MIKIHIWYPNNDSQLGHVSLEIPEKCYISFWPNGNNEKTKKPIKFFKDNKSTTMDDFAKDCFEMSLKTKLNNWREPNNTVTIIGIDEEVVINFWMQTKSNLSKVNYNLFRYNCSTCVATALAVGKSKKQTNAMNLFFESLTEKLTESSNMGFTYALIFSLPELANMIEELFMGFSQNIFGNNIFWYPTLVEKLALSLKKGETLDQSIDKLAEIFKR